MVGVGRPALEVAALAAETGAQVRVVARGKGSVDFGAPPWQQPLLQAGSPFGRTWSLWALTYHPRPYRHLPSGGGHSLARATKEAAERPTRTVRTRTVRTFGGRVENCARTASSPPPATASTPPRRTYSAMSCGTAGSYGPVMRFVCGTAFAPPRLVRHPAARHR
ncbi:hypothetical protein ACIOKD_16850 [Streptomyces sp. NPDC087844]|uniref:hypothetical protein n=1 Tax=Streptomyces sp. NPDC087844 TaxID=3365805 RepID=UPI0037F5E712